MFFKIPVTSRRSKVTHRNAFCAFCNYDLDEVIFWEVAVVGSKKQQRLRPPPFISTNFDRYMRQCSRLPLIGDCPVETNSTVTRSCWAFYAPVIDEASGSTYYKNAYCARCHGANLTATSCLPAEKTTTTLRVEVKITISLPDLDLSSIFRTVDRNSTCFSSYNGVCYIEQVTYRYANASTPNPNTAILIRGYLTIVCISVSLLCLVLKLVVYLMSKEYRTFSSRCTLCLSMTLFFTQLFFLVFNVTNFGRDVCVASSVVVHFGFLSTAFWTTVLSYDIWKTLILVRRPKGNWKSLVRYAFAGWGSPLLVVGVASILNWTKGDSPLSPSYGMSRCFINKKWSHVAFFLAPMLALLFVDIGFYLHTVFTIRRTESQSQKFDFKANEKPSRILLFVKLASIMGVSWLLGLISGLVNSLLMDCVSIVFIGLQGVFLFFGFRDHRHVSQMVSSSSSLVSGLLSYSRSRSSTTATTDLALGIQIPTIHGSSHDRRTSDDVASA
ncbi:probable G-protein coupled receptor Mth-like 2 [Rhipicephalus sanguineus]|uniref:probable G-protein coupled receptor Mth-like 2 n=1 Tax=Rhipicephalus sanguineus TaxID=34632 RepID=UPI0020C3641F|nr:probable G-protein coupled receptor Mth-like 2 [Rhipicephalus sanguineus]